jgi:DNA polymerase-3 subunit gamma/tau
VSAEVWYRKWRPRSFSEVTGQEHVTRTLARAVAQGRVAHAYLVCGPRGTGKTTTARVLAKAVNCTRPSDGEPCNSCESCVSVNEGRALDLVEMDAASNRGIDDIRSLRERVGYHPTSGRYRVYLIDEVHELTAQAFDALLKTLEEPPPHIIFVLATTDAHRVPATIVSRCQRFDLIRIRMTDAVTRLHFIAEQEGLQVEPGVFDVIARAATGSLRDAVNLLEQLAATYGAVITEAQARAALGMIADERARELALRASEGAFRAGLELLAAVQDDGVDMRQFNREVVAQLRALLLVKAGAEAGLEGLSAEALAELHRAAEALDSRRILKSLKAFSSAEFRADAQPSLPLELALAEVAFAVEPDASPERPPSVAPAARPVASRPAPTMPPAAAGAGIPRPTPVATPATGSPPAEVAETSPVAAGLEAGVSNGTTDSITAGLEVVITLEHARSAFRELYNACRAVDFKTGGLLNSGCDVVAIDAHTITFGFRHAWVADKLLPGTQSHRVLAGSVEQVLGRRLEVQCTNVPGVEDRLRANPARASHLLDEARRLGLKPVERD